MILVDSSVWIDHFRQHDPSLAKLLEVGQVIGHPFILGEIALGSLRQRRDILGALQALPQSIVANDAEVFGFIDQQKLYGVGIGYVDAHLLASTRLTPGASLYTRDKQLWAVAGRLGIAMISTH